MIMILIVLLLGMWRVKMSQLFFPFWIWFPPEPGLGHWTRAEVLHYETLTVSQGNKWNLNVTGRKYFTKQPQLCGHFLIICFAVFFRCNSWSEEIFRGIHWLEATAKHARSSIHEAFQITEEPLYLWICSLSLAVRVYIPVLTPLMTVCFPSAEELPMFSFWRVIKRMSTLIKQLKAASASTAAFQAQVDAANKAAEKYMEDNELLKKVRSWHCWVQIHNSQPYWGTVFNIRRLMRWNVF